MIKKEEQILRQAWAILLDYAQSSSDDFIISEFFKSFIKKFKKS